MSSVKLKIENILRDWAGGSVRWKTWGLLFSPSPSHGQVSLSYFANPQMHFHRGCICIWFTSSPPQAIIEVALVKELKLASVEAEPERIFIGNHIWAHVCTMYTCDLWPLAPNYAPKMMMIQIIKHFLSALGEGVPLGRSSGLFPKKSCRGVFGVEYYRQNLSMIIWLLI